MPLLPPTPRPWVCGQKPQSRKQDGASPGRASCPSRSSVPLPPTDPPRGPSLQRQPVCRDARQCPALPVGGFPLLRGVVAGEALQGLGPAGLVTLGLHKVCKDGAGKERVSAQQCVPAAGQAGFARSEASRELRGRAVMREGGDQARVAQRISCGHFMRQFQLVGKGQNRQFFLGRSE